MDADALLPRLQKVAEWAGITRVAALTRLDRIGLPVFQAIRPMGRALSVHQGKGRNDTEARVSAIMEAVESASAETVAANGPNCTFGALPLAERFYDLHRYGEIRQDCGLNVAMPMQWHEAEHIPRGGRVFVPFDIMSLDFTFDSGGPFVRSSLGLGAGANLEDATRAALYELVERDAQSHWLASNIAGQARAEVDTATIKNGWFPTLEAYVTSLGMVISIYAVHGAAGLPVVLCRIDDPGYAPACLGAACRADIEDALFRAFAEAAQSRLTLISGARDDITADEPRRTHPRAIGAPPGHKASWKRLRDSYGARPTLDEIYAHLIDTGHDDIARCDISPPCGGASVVRLIIAGLAGSPQCTR